MCWCRIASSSSSVNVPEVSHAGSWLCHTSVWPRTTWRWARAWATSRSAAEKSRTPRWALDALPLHRVLGRDAVELAVEDARVGRVGAQQVGVDRGADQRARGEVAQPAREVVRLRGTRRERHEDEREGAPARPCSSGEAGPGHEVSLRGVVVRPARPPCRCARPTARTGACASRTVRERTSPPARRASSSPRSRKRSAYSGSIAWAKRMWRTRSSVVARGLHG